MSKPASRTDEPQPESLEPQPQTLLTDATPTAPSSDPIPPPPNGGYGWVCTACVATINAHSWGLNSTYAVFLAYYLANETFTGATHLDFAFVGSLSISSAMLISPVATIMVREFGSRTTLLTGAVLESLSFIFASLARETWHLFLTQGILFGFGMGLLFVPSYSIIPQWFTTRRSLATGCSAAGSGIGGLIYSLGAGAMIRNLGLQWAFRILAVITFVVNVTCCLIIKDRNKVIGSTQLAFETRLLKRFEYQLILGYGSFSMLGYVVLVFSLANYGIEIGLNASQASVISALFNLGQAMGRPVVGYFSDDIGRINMAMFMSMFCGILSLAVWINAKSYGVLIFFALVGGSVAGSIWVTASPVTAEVIGLKRLPSGLNLLWLALVLPATFSEPIALEIVSGTGSYLGTQLFTGMMYIAGGVCVLLLRGWKIGEDEINEVGMAMGGIAPEDRKTLTWRQKIRNCFRWENV